MKKFNSLLARFMLVLLALHGLMGAFTLLRMTTSTGNPFLIPFLRSYFFMAYWVSSYQKMLCVKECGPDGGT